MPTGHVIEIVEFEYKPEELVVQVGDTVKWINRDEMSHTATRDLTPTFDTGFLGKDQESAEIVFSTASDKVGFEYFCSPHPFMIGRVIVTLAGTNPSSYTRAAAVRNHQEKNHEKDSK